MGQQQLLLIVLGVIIVGIAVVTGIIVFQSNAIENKRDVVISESVNLAHMAITYYKKVKLYGGGQNSFIGWKIPEELKITNNGSYEVESLDSSEVRITGIGNAEVTGENLIEVKTIVKPDSIRTIIIK